MSLLEQTVVTTCDCRSNGSRFGDSIAWAICLLYFCERLSRNGLSKIIKTKIQGVRLSLVNTKCNAPNYSAQRRAHKFKMQRTKHTVHNSKHCTTNTQRAQRRARNAQSQNANQIKTRTSHITHRTAHSKHRRKHKCIIHRAKKLSAKQWV